MATYIQTQGGSWLCATGCHLLKCETSDLDKAPWKAVVQHPLNGSLSPVGTFPSESAIDSYLALAAEEVAKGAHIIHWLEDLHHMNFGEAEIEAIAQD